jgi:hypothetical protein
MYLVASQSRLRRIGKIKISCRRRDCFKCISCLFFQVPLSLTCMSFILNPLPSLTLQSARDLNALCRPKRSKALLLSHTFKCPLKKRSLYAHAVGL